MIRQALGEYVVHVRIGMDGQDDRHILPEQDPLQSFDDIEDALAEIFAAVAGYKDDSSISVMPTYAVPARGKKRVRIDDCLCANQSIDDRVSGYVYSFARHILRSQSPCSPVCWSKMLVGNGANDLPVHLFRPGGVYIAAPQPGLNMRYRD